MSEFHFPADVPTKPFLEEVTAVYGGTRFRQDH